MIQRLQEGWRFFRRSPQRFLKELRCYLICYRLYKVKGRMAFDRHGMVYYCPRCQSASRAGVSEE
jgi:hypothetical protein